MNPRNIFITEDGSSSFFDKTFNESFHSTHGAIAESEHIFIKSALELFRYQPSVSILEIGWGTGLNTLLSMAWQRAGKHQIRYFAIEKFPLQESEFSILNYFEKIADITGSDILNLHSVPWNEEVVIDEGFQIFKSQQDIAEMQLPENEFDVVFFDAFSPDRQPELWTEEVFAKIYKAMRKGGVLTTYSVKGSVRRNMKAAGLRIEKIPGPAGKREISRAFK